MKAEELIRQLNAVDPQSEVRIEAFDFSDDIPVEFRISEVQDVGSETIIKVNL